MSRASLQLRPALALSAFVVVVAALGSLTYTETAAIKIAVPPQKVQAQVALNSSGAADLAVQHVDVQVTDAAQGTASSVTIAPAYATGSVRFLYVCPAIQACPLPLTMPAGIIVATRRGHLRYLTRSPATFVVGQGQYQTVGIRAVAPGAAYNVGPGWIQLIDNPPWPYLVVNNYGPTSGGVDGRIAQIVQQSDLDAVRATLAARARDELAAAMADKTIGMTYLVDGPATLDSTSNHVVGDETPGFTLTLTGRLGARAFSNDRAQALLRAVLQPLVRPGYTLAVPIQATYKVVPAANGTDLIVSADAIAYAMPTAPMPALRSRLAGLGVPDASMRLRQYFPGSSIDIRIGPLPLPWLPMLADHINLTLLVEPPPV